MADSRTPGPANGKTLSIAAVVSVLVLGGMFAGGALFVVRSSDAAQERAVDRCRALVEAERRSAGDRYAPAAAVVRLEAKVDSLTDHITELRGDVRALRAETRAAVARRPPARGRGRTP
jgi:hypothetical protein